MNCSCHAITSGNIRARAKIAYCGVHDTAQEMLKLLKKIQKNGETDSIGHDLLAEIDMIIDKAEGGT